jgi:hypothetical protein
MPPALLGAVVALAIAGPVEQAPPDPRDSGPDRIDVSSYPEEYRARYDVFAAKCCKCHPLARPINSRFDATEWKRYMKRMIRRPNSGINEEQALKIYEFLKFYSARVAGQ